MKVRILLLLLLMMIPVGLASAATSKWATPSDTSDSERPHGHTFSASDKTTTGKYSTRAQFIVDFAAKRAWVKSSKWKQYWDGTSKSTTFASVTGYDLSAFGTQSLYFSVFSGRAAATGCSMKIHPTRATQVMQLPPGYSAWADILGTTQFTTSPGANNVTLSESNTVATATSSTPNGYYQVRTDTSFALGSTGKAVMEVELGYDNSGTHCDLYRFCLVNSTYAPATDDCSNNTNSMGVDGRGSANTLWMYNSSFATTNKDAFYVSEEAPGNPEDYYKFLRGTVAFPATKVYFEVAFSASNLAFLGWVDETQGAWSPFDSGFGHTMPGYAAQTMSALIGSSSTCYSGNTTRTCNFAAITVPKTVGVAVDTSAVRTWWIHNGSGSDTWYGSASGADPVTGTNGVTTQFGTTGSGPFYPAIATYPSVVATINGGATAFTYTKPSGFTQLDSASGRNRSIIFGMKEEKRTFDPMIAALIREFNRDYRPKYSPSLMRVRSLQRMN